MHLYQRYIIIFTDLLGNRECPFKRVLWSPYKDGVLWNTTWFVERLKCSYVYLYKAPRSFRKPPLYRGFAKSLLEMDFVKPYKEWALQRFYVEGICKAPPISVGKMIEMCLFYVCTKPLGTLWSTLCCTMCFCFDCYWSLYCHFSFSCMCQFIHMKSAKHGINPLNLLYFVPS